MKDNIFSDEQVAKSGFLDAKEKLKSFAFNSSVASVFDDMISRSVPGYNSVQNITSQIALEVIQTDTNVYDIGTSTGTTLIRLISSFQKSGLPPTGKYIGVDSSEDMLKICQGKLSALNIDSYVSLEISKVEDVLFSNASLIVCHYTLQFLDPTVRLTVLKNMYDGLNDNGALIISEKIKYLDPILDTLMTRNYYSFKKENGYSEAEISRKREALENVLIPLTLEENIELFKNAGFQIVDVVYSNLLFFTFVVKKQKI